MRRIGGFRTGHCYGSGMKPTAVLRLTFILAAAASFVFSVWLYFANGSSIDDKLNGIYVGIWVPSILAFGGFLLQSFAKKDS